MRNDTLIEGKTVDITPLFKAAHIPTPRLTITETAGMYPYKQKVEENWAYFTGVGMKRLKSILDAEGKKVRDIGIVGICSGVEGIAVAYIFSPQLENLIVTDIDKEILQGTVINLKNSTQQFDFEVTPLIGSFCEPIEEIGRMVDLVHANVPNLPSRGDEDLTKGAEKGTFLPPSLYEWYQPPEKYLGWAMGAQYAYLASAKKVVRDGGTIITELGGRMPIPIVRELFHELNLELQEVIVGFKEQTEALIDFTGYHTLEREYGNRFEFYLYNESKKILQENRIENPTSIISAEEYKQLLEPFTVSAGEAIELYTAGIPVGHTVHLFRGIQKEK